jgi:hypothetical protein
MIIIMEDLLQSVHSARRDIQERRNSRMRAEKGYKQDIRLQIASPRSNPLYKSTSTSSLSKNPIEKHSIGSIYKLPSNDFTRYLQSPLQVYSSITKSSPVRKRTYKLDAAVLLCSRIKEFIAKHFRLWKKITSQINTAEKNLFDHKALVFKVSLGPSQAKNRYISRDMNSDDELLSKSSTKRFSPMSPVLFDFNKGKSGGCNTTSDKTSIIEVIAEDFQTNKATEKRIHSAYNNHNDKLLPSSTRAASSFSQRSSEKFSARPVKNSVLEKLFRILSEKYKKKILTAFTGLIGNLKYFETLANLLKVLNTPLRANLQYSLTQILRTRNYAKVIRGSAMISGIFLNKITEIFHFIKFRSVVESVISEVSIGDSSKDDFKDCLENIKNSLNKKSKLSYSFVSILEVIEKKAVKRYYFLFMDLLSYTRKTLEFVHLIGKVGLSKSFKCILSENKENKMYKFRINSLYRNILKNVRFRCAKCFEQWKFWSFDFIENDILSLKVLTMSNFFENLMKNRAKAIFYIYRANKDRKHSSVDTKNKKIVRGTIKLDRLYKKIKRLFFYDWKTHPGPKNPNIVISATAIKRLNSIFLIRIRYCFVTLNKNSFLLSQYKAIALKSVLSNFKQSLRLIIKNWKKNSLRIRRR